ncbi:MAG: isoprenoid biosynthesis protein ElbB [Candidatus Wallbacteria bacterium HGW-Wallbacteria-1]|jgi:enhancing lycopene biosynthesis protein 2|uniref:Isoprenoid biosynthesis protein ElbB n=1 Tax=Candidatus Wallbacteria bacterium HGW-Wallbacteria-1 TaxID=2013854 RepID=A0A2N1PK71_9BACT|nr:MAG: isoprenoid biosynthesis protein ElbB [Candidatus Wallbacteria bacterium HGW-Wallbacteria-1]
MPRIACVLSGCGVKDGSEIHETVMSYYALDRRGAKVEFFAPSGQQADVINHLTGESSGESRDMLIESARIGRGAVREISELNPAEYDGIFFPGGFGAARNLSDFVSRGVECDVHPQVRRVIDQAYDAGKVIGAVCIAPVLVARVLGQRVRATVTVGSDAETASAIEAMGCRHQITKVREACVDHEHRLVTAAAYMLASTITELHDSVDAAAEELIKLL